MTFIDQDLRSTATRWQLLGTGRGAERRRQHSTSYTRHRGRGIDFSTQRLVVVISIDCVRAYEFETGKGVVKSKLNSVFFTRNYRSRVKRNVTHEHNDDNTREDYKRSSENKRVRAHT